MNLKLIAAISGMPGLYRVVKPARTGVIVEPINEPGKRFMAAASSKLSILDEITMYTTDAEGNVPLSVVFKNIKETFGDKIPVDGKSDASDLRAFMLKALPSFDQERVYASDMKKLASWYLSLVQYAPEVFVEEVSVPAEEQIKEVVTEVPAEEVEKPKAKKAKAKAEPTTETEVAEAKPKAEPTTETEVAEAKPKTSRKKKEDQ